MMIKAILHKTFSVTLSCLVLFSTLSFTVEKHYCGNHLVDVAIFTKAENCGMDLEAFSTANFEKKHCCKDEIQVVKGQDKLKKSSFEDLLLYEGLPEQVIPHKNYSPPNLVADIHVLDQVFLI